MFADILLIPKEIMFVIFFIYGSICGSFANVLIYRMQKEESLNLLKPSYCPQCFYKIPFYLNIPLLSWFILKGDCKSCNKPISFRYPLVEFLMAVFFSCLFLAIGWKWFLLEALLFVFALVVASFIDWDQMILPFSLTGSGICLGLLGGWLNPERLFLEALFGALLGGGIFLSIYYLYYFIRRQEGMGGGDIHMITWIGAVLSWKSLFFVIFTSCALGSVMGLALIGYSKITSPKGDTKSLQTPLPFGPYLAISAVLYIFVNQYFPQYTTVFFIPYF